MHVVNKISSLINLKPQNKSDLLLEFFPIPFSKYITIYNESAIPSNDYYYYNDIFYIKIYYIF